MGITDKISQFQHEVIPKMAKIVKPLTDAKVKAAKPKNDGGVLKVNKLFDGGGLYLEVPVKGNKRWRIKYRFGGKEGRLSLGVYPHVSLSNAREKREEVKSMVAQGIDPAQARREEKAARQAEDQRDRTTFEYLADAYFDHKATLADAPNETTLNKARRRIAKHAYPTLRNVPAEEITEADVLEIVHTLTRQGYHEIARRVLQMVKAILAFGKRRGFVASNVAADINPKEEIGKITTTNFPIISEPKPLGELLRVIDGYTGNYSTLMALKLMPYVAFRPANIRYLEWSEIDLETATISIPGEKMKMKRAFTTPTSRQAAGLLRQMQRFSGAGRYVFPSATHKDRPLSENTLNSALRRLGYERDQLVSHSFRGIFSTFAHNHGKDHLAIELQLAHKDIDQVSSAYNRAEMMEIRRELMQWWADFLDEVKA
jgi:integrase